MSKQIKWHSFFSRGQHHMIVNDIVWRSFKYFPEYLSLPVVHAYRRDSSTYLDLKEYNKLIRIIRLQLTKQTDKFIKIKNKFYLLFAEVQVLVNSYKKIKWPDRGVEAARQACLNYYKKVIPTWAITYWPIWVDVIIHDLLVPVLKKKFGNNWQEVYWLLTELDDLTMRQEFEFKILKLARLYKEKELTSKELIERADNLVKKYSHVRSYLFKIDPYTRKEVIEEIKKQAQTDPAVEIEVRQITRRKHRQKKKELFKHLFPHEQKLIKIVVMMNKLRDDRLDYWSRFNLSLRPLFKYLAESMKLTEPQFYQLTIEEFSSGVFSKDELDKRSKGYCFTVIGNKIDITYSKKIRANTGSDNLVKGIIANRGKVVGRVQLGDAYTFHKLKPGSVVVAAMTTPDSVAYIKRVKAIVTDEGGATAHAAIIAREFNIPCIVGTRVATKVFKNGQKVEVDANKGIVKLIK